MRNRQLLGIALLTGVLQASGPLAPAGSEERVHELLPMVVEAEALQADKAGSPVVDVMDPDREIPAGQISDITGFLQKTDAVFIQDSSYGKRCFFEIWGTRTIEFSSRECPSARWAGTTPALLPGRFAPGQRRTDRDELLGRLSPKVLYTAYS